MLEMLDWRLQTPGWRAWSVLVSLPVLALDPVLLSRLWRPT